jgi:carbohydrate kinase (thermoresistant glucokinase family)
MTQVSYVVFGVSGCGKSTVGRALAERLKLPFHDADDYHPQANIDKMASGQPLNDADRQPWLGRLNRLLIKEAPLVLACSALKQSYRETLSRDIDQLRWVLLNAHREVLFDRLEKRIAEGSHFMPAELLQSQIDTLEKPATEEDAMTLDATLPVYQLVDRIASR